MPSDQEIVDEFAKLIVGQDALHENDPRAHLIEIARISLLEYVSVTRWAYDEGQLPLPDDGQFKPKFEVIKGQG